jgi:hypothetical protein
VRGNGALASRAPFANKVGGTETEETRASSFVHPKTSFYPITPFIRFRVDLQDVHVGKIEKSIFGWMILNPIRDYGAIFALICS